MCECLCINTVLNKPLDTTICNRMQNDNTNQHRILDLAQMAKALLEDRKHHENELIEERRWRKEESRVRRLLKMRGGSGEVRRRVQEADAPVASTC